ncbi:MAG: V-type ATPase subunit [Clostridia bacterium]|nr:V-type ATPase subunit [Clostridia bacterium]
MEYAYAVAYIKTLENKMLTRSDLESLIHIGNIDSAIKYLKERGWEGQSKQELLKNEYNKAWEKAYEVLPENTPVDMLLYERDFHNLKTVLKALLSGRDYKNMVLSPCNAEAQEIETAVKTGNYEALPEFIRDTAKEAYKLLTLTMDGQLMEVFVDKREHLSMLDCAKKDGGEFYIGYAELLIKLANLKTMLRCRIAEKSDEFLKNALIEKGNYETILSLKTEEDIKAYLEKIGAPTELGEVEKWCDNEKLRYVKKAKAECFSARPIMAFLIGKSFEIQAVRIILSCIENNAGEEIIRERLRDVYV